MVTCVCFTYVCTCGTENLFNFDFFNFNFNKRHAYANIRVCVNLRIWILIFILHSKEMSIRMYVKGIEIYTRYDFHDLMYICTCTGLIVFIPTWQ